jgi:hypothetical protein
MMLLPPLRRHIDMSSRQAAARALAATRVDAFFIRKWRGCERKRGKRRGERGWGREEGV